MKKIITLFVIMFLINIKVSAASLCSYKEQTEFNGKAANVKATYEIKERTIQSEWIEGEIEEILIGYYFNISITNVTDELYVVVKNNLNNEEKIFTSKDAKNGLINFEWDSVEEITNFTIQVYTSEKTNCPDERFKTIYLTTPRYNDFSERSICMEYTEFSLCQKFVTFSEVDDTRFVNELDKYKKEEEKNNENIEDKPTQNPEDNKFIDFINDYKWYFISGVAVVSIASFVIYRVKTKKQRELGL